MKKLKLQALELGSVETLTREQLKTVLGGGAMFMPTTTNPNCQGSGTENWNCCKNGVWTPLGSMDCNVASEKCPGGTITNDPNGKGNCTGQS